MPDGTIFDRLEQIRKSLDANQRKALLRVVQSYKSSIKYLDSDIDLLVKELSGAQMSVRDVQKLKAYQRIMGNSTEALQQFAAYLGIELRNEIDVMHVAGARDSVAVLGAYGKDIQALIRRVNPEQLAKLRNYVDPGMPLYNRLQQFGKYSADYISQMILEGVKAGKNPLVIAKSIVDAEGMGLNDAVRMMRTVQVYAYRDANQASYQANSDIVRGWVWMAQLDDATCFPKGTMIKTLRGTIPIEDVKINDEVLTHTGHWKKVLNTTQRPYTGLFVKISVLNTQIISTANHPFLVRKKGHLDWIRADEINTMDSIVIDPQYFGKERDHITGNLPIEWRIFDSINSMTPRFEPSGFSSVSFSDRFLIVPVKAINFYDDINVWQKEINRISPTRKTMFLNKPNRHILKTKPNVFLRFCFSCISSIASWATKFLMFKDRNYSKIFTTGKTNINNGRPSANFRTKFSFGIFSNIKNFSTSFAGNIFSIFSPTFHATNGISARVRLGNSKIFPTYSTFFSNLSERYTTFYTTKFGRTTSWIRKINSANFTNRTNSLIFCRVITFFRTIFSSAFSSPSIGNRESFTTYRTSIRKHNSIISKYAKEIQSTPVYNLEVEDDHSYIANGIVVHNCESCIAMHGTFHTVDETLDDHFQGRCQMLPQTILTRENTIAEGAGEAWFKGLPESQQQQIMGPGKWQAWKEDKFDFSQLSKQVDNDVFGTMRTASSLKDLIGE